MLNSLMMSHPSYMYNLGLVLNSQVIAYCNVNKIDLATTGY